jgi:Rrf2 family protein
MKITYKGDYALKTILNLAINYERGGVVTIHELAECADIPIKFLEQVLLDLKRGGFVKSRRGKIGGYALAKPPASIKVGDVVRYIDGPTEPIACVSEKYGGCNDMPKCLFRHIWKDVARATTAIINNITFENLINKIKGRTLSVGYQI